MHYKNSKNQLFWLDSVDDEHFLPKDCIQITEEEADAIRAAILKEHLDSYTYAQRRIMEYPSIQDQLDTIFHSGLDVWKQQIQTIKNKYPKE